MLNSGAAPVSHEWLPCGGDMFPTYEAFEFKMVKLAERQFFVVRFKRALNESASGNLPRVYAFCNRSSWGRL